MSIWWHYAILPALQGIGIGFAIFAVVLGLLYLVRQACR